MHFVPILISHRNVDGILEFSLLSVADKFVMTCFVAQFCTFIVCIDMNKMKMFVFFVA